MAGGFRRRSEGGEKDWLSRAMVWKRQGKKAVATMPAKTGSSISPGSFWLSILMPECSSLLDGNLILLVVSVSSHIRGR